MINPNMEKLIYEDDAAEEAWIKEECDCLLQAAFAKLDEMLENNDEVLGDEIEVTVDIT